MIRNIYVILTTLVALTTTGIAIDGYGVEGEDYIPGEVLVKFVGPVENITMDLDGICHTGIPEIDALNEEYGVYEMGQVFPEPLETEFNDCDGLWDFGEAYDIWAGMEIGNTYLLKFNTTNTVYDVDMAYSSIEPVIYAEPDYIAQPCFTPSDPYFDEQWYLHTNTLGNGYYTIDAERAWDYETGAPRIVAVLDSGIREDHFELSNKIVFPWNELDNNYDVTDYDDHGTPVSGIIAANTNGTFGIAGISWYAKIMPVKVLQDGHPGDGAYKEVAEAIYYATKKGASVINMSLAGPYGSETLGEACIVAYRWGRLLVAGSGNTWGRVYYPAAYSEVIAVAASDQLGNKRGYSCWGRELEFLAPGGDLIEGYDQWDIFTTSNNARGDTLSGYRMFGGTSSAAPVFSGVAMLAWSRFGHLNNVKLRKWLQGSTKLANGQTTAPDWHHGYGIINSYYAVTADKGEGSTSGERNSKSDNTALNADVKISLADTEVYPNPASSATYVRFRNDGSEYDVSVFDISGRKIRDWAGNEEGQVNVKWDLTQADGARVSEGVYLIKAENSEDSVVKKVIISQ